MKRELKWNIVCGIYIVDVAVKNEGWLLKSIGFCLRKGSKIRKKICWNSVNARSKDDRIFHHFKSFDYFLYQLTTEVFVLFLHQIKFVAIISNQRIYACQFSIALDRSLVSDKQKYLLNLCVTHDFTSQFFVNGTPMQ